MAVTYRKPVDDDIAWDQRLANYASNKDAGLSEYQRALEVYRGKSAAGDTEGANAAKKWSDQVNTAIGGIGNNRTAQINNTTDTIGQKVNVAPFQFKQTAAPFQYNAQSDPAYQAALREAQRNTQTAAGNTAAAMNARGIMDSTITTDRVGQQAQQQYSHVSDTILPQLMQQAYGRYQDDVNNEYRTQLANYQASQDQIGNLTKYAGTLNGLNQQELDNAYRDNTFAESQKQNNYDAYLKSVGLTGDLGTGPKSDWSLLGDRSGNLSLPGQQYADNKVQQGIENTRADRQLNATLYNMSSDNARAAAAEARAVGNQQLGALFDVWDRTGVAPEGIPGVQAGTPLNKGTKPTSTANEVPAKDSANNYATIIDDLSGDGVTKDQAVQLAKANSQYLSDSDYRKLMDYIAKTFG